MTEERKRTIDVALGIVVPILTIAGILVGVWQFNVGEQNRTRLEYELLERKDRIEFQRKLWLERLSTYRSIAETVGRIASTHKSDSRFRQLAGDFDAAYWGETVFVEDQEVEKEMIKFHLEILDYEAGRTEEEHLKLRADQLVKSLRKSVESGNPPESLSMK